MKNSNLEAYESQIQCINLRCTEHALLRKSPVRWTLTYLLLLMPVYSLGAWAIDQSSPPDPALRHGCNFLPGVPHLPRFRLHISPPGVSWPSSFPLPLGIPCQCLSCDASCRFSQRVTNPTPFSSFYLYFYWQLICLGPQSVVADFV